LVTTRRLRRHATRNAYVASHDLLTGLPNRRAFQEQVQTCTESSTVAAVINMDRFADVNNTIGHANGDAVLLALSVRLRDAVAAHDFVAHLGGDEFGVILHDMHDEPAAVARLNQVRDVLAEPLEVAGIPLIMDSRAGFIFRQEDGLDADVVLQRADIALQHAKSAHAGVVGYAPSQDHFDPRKLALASELRRAIYGDELVLHYQPKMSLRDDSITAVEALIRWQHPRRGLLFPDAFLTAAEQTDLIDPLTEWVVSRAIEQVLEWQRSGVQLAMSVNVSARNLANPLFVASIREKIEDTGVAPELLVIEVTETAVLADLDHVVEVLTQLTELGIRISLDDFGQGQTSLSFLTRLPLAELKLDKVFVDDLQEPAQSAIVRSMIDLAHQLGFKVVVEGVEDEPTREALRSMGCDEMQGYLLSRPQDPAALELWLRDQRTAPVEA
jgi:diguanylate cyclase (GGDEF)-like protein